MCGWGSYRHSKHIDLSSKGIHSVPKNQYPFKHYWIHFYGHRDNHSMVFFVPNSTETYPITYLLWSVKEFLCFVEKTNEWYFITNNGVVNLPLNRNNTTDSMCDWMATLVGNLMRTQPMNELDFLLLIILFGIVVYCFKYIRNHKW